MEVCQSPSKLPDGIIVACRNCWQCRQNYTNDWVGRCIAESKTSVGSSFVTLTYGTNDSVGARALPAQAAVLTYTDVQRYFKRLRNLGYPMRYFCVGEYGSAKGRAHWHLLLFWSYKVPVTPFQERFMHIAIDPDHAMALKVQPNSRPVWDLGYSSWDLVNPANIRYVCKYMAKGVNGDINGDPRMAMSKKPPLGYHYFNHLADMYVQQGLSPQDLFYRFPDVRDKATNRPQEFMLSSVSARNYLYHFLQKWSEVYERDYPQSDLIDEYLDCRTRDVFDFGYSYWMHKNESRLATSVPKLFLAGGDDSVAGTVERAPPAFKEVLRKISEG